MFGRRIQIGAKTGILYDGINLISDSSSRFLNSLGLDDQLSLTNASNQTFSYVKDHLGSTRRLTDLTGTVTSIYNYSPYGNSSNPATSPANAANPFTYTGREEDETGLIYLRARYYDPILERFISDDPMGDAQRYVSGNPLTRLDPLGLIDLLFNNTSLGHIAILTEPQIRNGGNETRYLYGNGLGQGNNSAQGPLVGRDKPIFPFNDFIVQLDPNIFGNDKDFFTQGATTTSPYSLIPIPYLNPAGNCSGYVGEFLNKGLRKKGLPTLKFTATPTLLLLELQAKGYIENIYKYR